MHKYTRDDSNLHTAPTYILWLNFLAWALALVGGILVIFTEHKIIGLIILGCITAFGVFTDNYYNYHENAKLEIEKRKITYTYNLNSGFVPTGNTQVTIVIKNIKRIKRRYNKLKITGNITKKAPLGKVKAIRSCEVALNNYTNGTAEEIINNIQHFKINNKGD